MKRIVRAEGSVVDYEYGQLRRRRTIKSVESRDVEAIIRVVTVA